MVKAHLFRLTGERKLRIVDVARDTGINRGTITRLYHETATRIVEKLCIYTGCSVADMVEVLPNNKST